MRRIKTPAELAAATNPNETVHVDPAARGPLHTAEPWHYAADVSRHGTRLVYAADGRLVADAGRIHARSDGEMEANAARIVACVNACAGIADPADAIAKAREALELASADLSSRMTAEEAGRNAALWMIRSALPSLGKP